MASVLETQALPATEKLVQKDEDELILELGRRLNAVALDPILAGEFDPRLPQALGPLDDLKKGALVFLKSISQLAFGAVCGDDPDGAELRETVVVAVAEGSAKAAAALAAVLVAGLGLAPAIAAAVAAVLIKQFLKTTYKATCTAWGKSLKKKRSPRRAPAVDRQPVPAGP